MRHVKHSTVRMLLIAVLVIFIGLCAQSTWASTGHEKAIYSFGSRPDGAEPLGNLIADASGNLYGRTLGGGTTACRCGTVFELTPPSSGNGAWTETVLHSFQGTNVGGDGWGPAGNLFFDKAGNLYGSTEAGGQGNYGAIFELSPPAAQGGLWTETILYSFPRRGKRGRGAGWIVLGSNGNIYGTTFYGGTGVTCSVGNIGCGVAFELVHPTTPGGAWTQHVLYEFGASADDSAVPTQIVMAPSGTLYGMAASGGSGTKGTFFKLAKENGHWTEDILYNFSGGDGAAPKFGIRRSGECFRHCGIRWKYQLRMRRCFRTIATGRARRFMDGIDAVHLHGRERWRHSGRSSAL